MKHSLTMRVFTGFLALVMLFGMIPMDAHATGTDDVYFEEASNVELDMAEITELVEGTEPAEEPTEPETVPETEPETVPETEPETVPETEPETVPETEPETVPETEPETVPETKPAPAVTELDSKKSTAKKSGTADVIGAAELETALAEGKSTIRITGSFEIDRTFYITKNTVIYTETAQTLTRAADFTGDIFVVGEAADGTVCAEEVKLTLGKADSEEKDLLIIDGNKDHMAEGVVAAGSVIFLSGKGQADLYENLTVRNAKKAGNARTAEDRYALTEPANIGGAVAIVTADAVLNIYGGSYRDNAVNDEGEVSEGSTDSTLGGVIYALGKVNLEGGLFEGNHATRGGVIYANGAELGIKDAQFKTNTASMMGGAIYATGRTDAESWDMMVDGSAFTGNSTTQHGGAIYIGGDLRAYMTDVEVTGNQTSTGYYGGGIYATSAVLEINGGTFKTNTAKYGGGIALYTDTEAVFNNITAEGNSSTRGGFIQLNSGAKLTMYNSTVKNNASTGHAGAISVYTDSNAKIYNTLFEGNSGAGSGGAIVYYCGTADNILHSCTFNENTNTSNGGVFYLSTASGLAMYNCIATNNTAAKGGFMYETTTGSTVTISGLTVSGNTATTADGGNIIWGNSTGAKLYINKSNYVDLDHTGAYDDAYWASAIVNKLSVEEVSTPIPDYLDYGEAENLAAVYDVDSAQKLEKALQEGRVNIRIAASFPVDRTFYITQSTKIFAESAVTLTRDPAFAGDIFVVGESGDGTPSDEIAVLTLGDAAAATDELLVIDGNKDNMTANVVGSVIFVTGKGQADLYPGLTVQNAKKVGNERTSDTDHGVSYPDRIGGAVAILASKSRMNIYGGTYRNNAVNAETSGASSFQGGAIYNFGTLNIYGGLFEGNYAGRGAAIYNYRTLKLYKAEIKNNSTSGSGGAIYAAASTACHTHVGGENEVVTSSVLFSGNSSGGGGGAILGQMDVKIRDAVFEDNTAGGSGGALNLIECDPELVNVSFKNNTATEDGGALYSSKNKLNASRCDFSGNKAVNGGAVCLSGATDAEELDVTLADCEFATNTATADGGAMILRAGVRVAITDGTFTENTAAANGGGVCLTGEGTCLDINGGTFEKNVALNGGGMSMHDSALAVCNNLTIRENESTSRGGFCYVDNGELNLYNSTAKKNKSGDHGAVICVYTAANGTAKVYNTVFEENESNNYGGAIVFYNTSKDHIVHSCTFTNNKAKGYGGAIFISGGGGLGLYNLTATGNSASHGGFLYETKAGTIVTLSGLTVSGNTDTNGGPIIWGNTLNAKLYLNKSNYVDLDHTGTYDDAYWAKAIYNKLTVIEDNTPVPDYLDYGEIDVKAVYDVKSAEKLEKALLEGRENLRIVESFPVDRTFYITKSTKIFAESAVTLARDPAFAGDIFVVGESGDGTPSDEIAVLTLGDAAAVTDELLVIDGNKDNMTADVVGSVIFVTGKGQADLYPGLTVQNAKKVGNERTSDTDHGVSYPDRIGGAVAILASKSRMNIYGGTYRNNAVNAETSGASSFQGGAIYNFGTLNIYGGLFEGNYAGRGAAIYNYRTLKLYKAEIKNNSTSGSGGAIYAAASTACHTHVGGENEVVTSSVLFSGNSSGGGGGAILGQMDVKIRDAVFENNTAGGSGGALNLIECDPELVNVSFKNNTATEDGGALYSSKNKLNASRCDFSGNKAVNGGAVCLSGATDAEELDVTLADCEFATNTATADGGAMILRAGVRVAITDGTFTENTAAANGGAVCAKQNSLSVTNTGFTGNHAAAGGAIALDEVSVELADCEFTGNAADANGGAVFAKKGNLYVKNGKFSSNTAVTDGGAIALEETSAELISTDFTANTAASGGAMALYEGAYASMNQITTDSNQAGQSGFIHIAGSVVSIYNSSLKNNIATGNAGAVGVYSEGTLMAYDVIFEGNTAQNGGALEIASGSTDNLLQTCTFAGNTASGNGGAAAVSAASKVELYNTTATGNTAVNGGILYVAEAGTNVKQGALTVSGNTSGSGFVAGGDGAGVLELDKTKYTDSDTAQTLDEAYWAAAITGVQVNEAALETPRYPAYGNEDPGDALLDAVDVKSADELEAALLAATPEIRITESFTLDRTFYVTSSTVIFSTAKITLTRDPNFAGDLFVVGKKADLTPAEGETPAEPICLKLGNPDSKTQNLLTINGNKSKMNVDVVGTVLFVYGPHHADLYDNLTIRNAHKVGNERVQDGVDTDIISYPKRVGGAAVIMTKNSSVNIYGGNYLKNSVRDETGNTNDDLASSQGGVIYNYGTLRVYGGKFAENHGSRGGVFYNYRTIYIYNAEILNNSSYSLGGVMYVPNSTACKTYIGLDNDVVQPHVVFSGNHAGNNGGVLYAQKVVEIHNAVFEGNTTNKYGAAIVAYNGTTNISNVLFKDNEAVGAGGAIYGSNVTVNIRNSEFVGNDSATSGGAIYFTGQGSTAVDLQLSDVKFTGNHADNNGGALSVNSDTRVRIAQSEFTGNQSGSAEAGGGAIYAKNCDLTINGSNFNENKATYGGAVYLTGTKTSQAEGEDGIVWDVQLKNCSFNKNTASYSGGGLCMTDGVKVKMKSVSFTENAAKSTSVGGGAIYVDSATLDIDGAQLTGNKATENGGGIYFAGTANAELNELTAQENTASGGGVIYHVGGTVNLYNSNFSKNKTTGLGGAICVYPSGTITIYNSVFEENHAGNNGGALCLYSTTVDNVIHTCTFTNNVSEKYGGAIFLSKPTGLKLYRTVATGNHGSHGGFLYETTAGADVTIGELIVSGNTDANGGPIIWGNTFNAKLHIDPSTYVDLDHQGEYDEAYWAAAIYNKLTYDFINVEVPYFLDYASVDPGEDFRDGVKVTSAKELEAALKGENPLIRIADDFEVDRTFYITKEVYIYSTAPCVLTRAPGFAGDIFVVGEDAKGKSALLYGDNAHLHLGLPTSDKNDLLIIDGNRDAMTVPVTGSVIFMSNGARVDLYEPLTIQNCYKSGNDRVLNKSKYGINNAFRIGATLILNINGSLNIRGGKYINNMGGRIDSQNNPDKNATLGGMIYSYGALNMYGGLFENNQGGQGGVMFASATTRITGGKFIGNTSDSTAGVIYVGSYSSSHLIIGKTGEGEGVLFEGNKAGSNGSCIYAPMKASVIIHGNTVFKDNATDTSGTINVYGQLTVKDTKFINNSADNRGGAIYISVSVDPESMPTRYVVIENCTFTGNKGGLGGAIQMYSGGADYKNGSKVTVTNSTFENNSCTYFGGAIHMDRKSQLTLKNTVLKGNTANREGGAIYAVNACKVNVSDARFEKNTAKYAKSGGGGAICSYGSTVTVNNSIFTENAATYRGGAIYFTKQNLKSVTDVLKIQDAILTGNTAGNSGGAMYLDGIGAYMKSVDFKSNAVSNEAGSGGAITLNAGTVELDISEMTGNRAPRSGGAIAAINNSSVILNAVNATENQTDGIGGFLYNTDATVKLYRSKLEGNRAGQNGGAMYLDADAITSAYKCDLLRNTAVDGGAVYAVTGGKDVLLQDCSMISNTATGNGGVVYAGGKTDLHIYGATAQTNGADSGGVVYLTDAGTVLTLLGMKVSGNTAVTTGPVICGNDAQAELKINKSLYTDADVTTQLDAAYWASAVAGQLKVTSVTTKPSTYTLYKSRAASSSESAKKITSETVAPIFNLAKKSSDATINSTYSKLPKLNNKSNFQSRSTVKFPNINGNTVTVDTFVYPDHGTADNCTVGEGLLIYQAMCYKKAHPKEDVYIDIASYRFSVQAAVNINRNSRYFGYMRQLEDVQYDEYGFVRVAYLLVAAAKMGIHVNVVGHLDAYPISSGETRLDQYFVKRLNHTCDPAYVKNGVVGDYLNFTFVKWSLAQRGGTDMMHNKMCAVSHYLDKDGKTHKNAVFSSSSNLDGIKATAINANWKLQTATIVSDHAQIYNTAINYMRLTQKYSTYLDGIIDFQHEVNERSTKQIDLILEGRGNEIPKNEQIVYIGTEKDDVFELYFTPFGGDTYTWEEKYNPYCKYTRKLHDSEGYIVFGWSAAEYSRHAISNQIEDMVSDAFHTNKNLKNKLYIYAENFDESVYDDLKVGRDIGYLSINEKVHGTVHNKDLQFSYKENGQRYYVSLLNSLNVHGGTMSFQPNFALVIKETDVCTQTSVFNTIAKYSMGGATTAHDYGEELVKEATSTKHGYTYQKCAACGETKKIGTLHYSGGWIIDRAATPTKNGIRHKECKICGQITASGELIYTDPLCVDMPSLTGRTFTSSSTSAVKLNLSSTPRTFEALIQVPTTVTGRAGVIVGNYSGGTGNQINLEINSNGRPYLYIKSSKKAASVLFDADVRSKEPVHVAVSVSGNKASLYVNGVLKQTKTLSRTYPSVSSNFKIGGDNRKSNTRYFRGRIYSVNIFSDARTAAEIKRDVIMVPSDSHKLIHASYFHQESQQTKLKGQTAGKVYSADVKGAPKTIEAVVQLETTHSDYAGVITGNWNNSDAPQLNLEVHSGGKVNLRYFSEGNLNNYLFNTDIRSKTPVHIAVTMESTTAKLYVNGALKETATLTKEVPTVSGNFKIGGDNTGAQEQYFAGKIYTVKMFSDVRTASEVAKDRIILPDGTAGLIFSGAFATDLTEFNPEARVFSAANAYGLPSLKRTPKTVEAVVQVPKGLNERAGVIVGNYNGGSSNQLNLEIYEKGRVRLYSKEGTKTNSCIFKTDIRSDEPVHIAVTVSGKTAKLYVNGVYKEKIAMKNLLPSSALHYYRIGGDARNGNTSYFKGKIYSVTMFSDARTESELVSDIACVPYNAPSLLFSKTFSSNDHDFTGCTNGGNHVAGDWIVDMAATKTSNGIKHRDCTVCGRRLQVSEIIDLQVKAGEMNFNDAKAGLFFTSERETYSVTDKLATKTATIEVNLQLPKSVSSRAGTVLGNYNGGSSNQFNLEIYTGGRPKLWYQKAGKKYSYQFKTDIRSDNMVNMTVTITGTTAKLFIDGKLKETAKLKTSLANVTSNFKVGGDNRTGNSNYFKGTIYSVNVFNDIRTTSEIKMDKIYVPADSGNLLYSAYFNAPG